MEPTSTVGGLWGFLLTPTGAELLFGLIIVYPLWRICLRVGVTPWTALLVFVPVVGFVLVLAVLAIVRWPEERTPEAGR